MTRARDIANLVDANGDIVAGALDNVPASNDASALTTGTLAAARLPTEIVSSDSTPQLGGALDAQTNNITNVGNMSIGTSSPNTYTGYSTLTLDHATNGGLIDIERNGTLIGEIWAHDANTFAMQASGAKSIKFRTNGVDRLNIDSSGYVTKPSNPAFRVNYVGNNGNTSTLSAGKIQFNNAITNVGSHFDLTNNRFVAPVAGFYHFDIVAFTYEHPGGTIPATTSMSLFWQINGSTTVYSNYNYSASSARYEALSSSVGLYLNANDYVEAHNSRGTYIDTSGFYTQMSGHLVG